jgi:cytochrome c556
MRYRSRTSLLTGALALAGLLPALGCEGGSRTPAAVPTQASIDGRSAVALPVDGQQAVLREMRQMLTALGEVMAAAASEDTVALLGALAPVGSAAAADPALEALLPTAWKDLAERTHGGFDSLAAAIRRTHGSGALKDTVLVRLAQLSGSCTACHETFRLVIR